MTPDLPGTPLPSTIGAEAFVVDFLAHQPRAARIGLRLLFVGFTLLPLLVLGRPRLFHSLRPDLRERYFGKWYASPVYLVRMAAISLKSVLAIVWAGHPVVQRALGYHKASALPAIAEVDRP